MRNLNISRFAGFISLAFACNNVTKTDNKAVKTSETDTTKIVKANAYSIDAVSTTQEEKATDTELNYADSIDFEKYEVGPQKRIENAPIDWSSYPEAKDFKTRITEAYKTNDVNFAGHYITSVFGCGASCLMGFMVDVRDGKIYDLPLGEENSCLFAEDRALYNWMSRIFIAGVCKQNIEDKKVYYKAYLWNEDKKDFEKVEASEFVKK
ncbi:hypothetical protein ACFOWA_11725 [Pedobacter lithocola]|uniref:Lipoprotein n=1 Tax=Pedobacter lithocola TaxID=1908239 RepID=A0ABV8PC84_9SPHI